jgi:hypothetical protein
MFGLPPWFSLHKPDFVPIHRHRPYASLLAISALVLVTFPACVLIVPTSSPGGPHCGFAGRDTSCGTCVAAKCIEAVDACCADESCGGIIKDLESCSALQGSSCDRLGNASDSDGVHRELSACVAKQCHEVCASATPSNLTQCKPAYITSVDACSCELSTTPNSDVCTSVGHPNLRCCAPTGWPGPALRCNCQAIICLPIAGGCQCQLTDKDDQGRQTECKGGKHCCSNPMTVTCSCGDQACLPQDTEVPSCTIDQLACKSGEHQVESCSAPKP